MDKQDQRKTLATGHENHGVHLCHKCGWSFPNPHPSPKHRRAHKKICGTIEGYKLVKSDDETSHVHLSNDEHHSDEESRKTPSPRGLESSNSQKPGGGVGERLISGHEVFADAVAEFSDGGWNSGAEENLEPVTVKEDSAHIFNNDGFGGSPVATDNQLKKNSSNANQMQDPETSETTSFLAKVPDCRPEEPGIQLLHNKPGSPSSIYPNKVEGPIDGLYEGVSVDTGNGVTDSAFSLQVDAADNLDRNIPLREAPIREETSKLNVDDVASSEGARDFVPKEENSAEGHLELHQSADSLDVELLQHTSISANNSQIDVGLHTLQEGEEKYENACGISVPHDISNPTILIEDSEDPKGVKFERSSILQSHETIRNDEDDLKDVNSVERFIVLQSELSSMATEVPPGEIYIPDDDATQQNVSYKLMVIEESRKQHIVEPLVEGKTNVDQSSDDNGASLVDRGPDMNDQTGSLSKEQDSDNCCKFLEVNSPDFPVFVSNVVPADVSVCSIDNDKNTNGDDIHNGVTEESDRAVRTSTLPSDSKEPPLQKLSVNIDIVDGEGNSNHEKLETKSDDAPEIHFREGSMESEGNHHETYQTAGLIYTDYTHHVEEIKIDGVHIDGNDELEADTEKHDDETKIATLQPSGSLFQSQEKPLINNAEGYGPGVCEAGKIENMNRVEDQSWAGCLGKNTLPFESTCGNDTGDEYVKKCQSSLCKQSLTVSGSEHELNKEDIDIIGTVLVECARHANRAFELQTANLAQDKEMDPVSKDNQTKGFRGEAGGLLSVSDQDQGSNDLVKQQSGVSGIDGSFGICSRSDSLDCNWGSVSVLSLQSDVPAILDAETLPLVDSHASTEGNSNFKCDAAYGFQQSEKSEMCEPPSFMTLVEPGNEGQTNAATSEGQIGQKSQCPSSNPLQAGWFPSLPQNANDSEGRKRNEEIIAKVRNWSTGKHHAPLKSLLSEVAQDNNPKSTSTKENLGLENQKSEKAAEDNCAKNITRTVNSILGPESPATQVVKKEIAKEWNSPARYPSDIQREKRKVRGRPFWTQFVCCTSVNSQ